MNAPSEKPVVEFTLDFADLRDVVDQMSLSDLLNGIASPGHPHRIGSYQYTHSGGIFFPCDPRPEEVFIKDIARGLSTQHRFNGQTTKRMTVAEHSYHTSFHGPQEKALERLMHDSPEALIGDVIRPLKIIPLFSSIYLKVETGIMNAINARYHLDPNADIRTADEAVLKQEIPENIGSKAINHLGDAAGETTRFPFQYWSSELAELMFLIRFRELTKERGIEPF